MSLCVYHIWIISYTVKYIRTFNVDQICILESNIKK